MRTRVGLRWRMCVWCCMCIFGVGGEDGDGDEGGGERWVIEKQGDYGDHNFDDQH